MPHRRQRHLLLPAPRLSRSPITCPSTLAPAKIFSINSSSFPCGSAISSAATPGKPSSAATASSTASCNIFTSPRTRQLPPLQPLRRRPHAHPHLHALRLPPYLRLSRAHPAPARRSLPRPRRQPSRNTFLRVILPLSIPGLLAGATFAFVLSLGDFLAPLLVGGPSGTMIANIVQSLFGAAYDWPLGAADLRLHSAV